MVTSTMLAKVLELYLSVPNSTPTVNTATGMSACVRCQAQQGGEPWTRADTERWPAAGRRLAQVAQAAWTACQTRAAHLEHLDERDGEVQVGCVANPERDGVARANGHNGAASGARARQRRASSAAEVAVAACQPVWHEAAQHSQLNPRGHVVLATTKLASAAMTRGRAARPHRTYVSRSMLIACTLPLFTSPIASAAQKNMCLPQHCRNPETSRSWCIFCKQQTVCSAGVHSCAGP